MKTRSVRAGMLLAGALSVFFLSSHKPLTSVATAGNVKMEEYREVYNYVYEHICKPISTDLKTARNQNPEDYFSRCPSGYQPRIVTAKDLVKTDRYVSGKIVFYAGCTPSYVCNFKVCVDNGFAVVKSKENGEYMSVSAWINQKNETRRVLAKG